MTFHVMKRKSHDVFLFLSLFLGPHLDLSQVNFLYIKMRTCGKRPIPYWPYAYLGGLFGIDECLSCWRNSGRFGFLRNCFSEVGEVCLLTPNLRLGLGESNKSQLKLYLLQQDFLRHSWRQTAGRCDSLGKKQIFINLSQWFMVVKLANWYIYIYRIFPKSEAAAMKTTRSVFLGSKVENHWFNRDFFMSGFNKSTVLWRVIFQFTLGYMMTCCSPNFFNANYWFDFWFKIVKDT